MVLEFGNLQLVFEAGVDLQCIIGTVACAVQVLATEIESRTAEQQPSLHATIFLGGRPLHGFVPYTLRRFDLVCGNHSLDQVHEHRAPHWIGPRDLIEVAKQVLGHRPQGGLVACDGHAAKHRRTLGRPIFTVHTEGFHHVTVTAWCQETFHERGDPPARLLGFFTGVSRQHTFAD